MLQDCLQALSTLKQGVSTPRMAPTEPSTVGGIVPPVGVNAKKPRKMRIPRNALAGPDHPRTPSGSGRRRTVTSDDPAKASGTCCSAAPVPVASTKTHRKSHSGGLSILPFFVVVALLRCVAMFWSLLAQSSGLFFPLRFESVFDQTAPALCAATLATII